MSDKKKTASDKERSADGATESRPTSLRPATLDDTPSPKGVWHMRAMEPGHYALVDPNGNEVAPLLEPLHEHEIQALGEAFRKTAMSGIEQGRAKEKNKIRQLVNLAFE